MKVIIAGSRNIDDEYHLFMALKAADFEITEVVCGGARGVDELGKCHAICMDIPFKMFIPDWNGLGRRAGFVRNGDMGDYADALIAIWDGQSKGTKNMIDYMTKLNKKVFVYKV